MSAAVQAVRETRAGALFEILSLQGLKHESEPALDAGQRPVHRCFLSSRCFHEDMTALVLQISQLRSRLTLLFENAPLASLDGPRGLSHDCVQVNPRTMQIETRFLRLKTPVTLGSYFDDWRVTWLGGWTYGKLSYLVMVARVTKQSGR